MDRGITMIWCLALVAILLQGAAADTFVVGGSVGWVIPPNTTTYSIWADSESFKTGDTLVFNFTTGQHDVAEVSKANYDSCSGSNVIGTTKTSGPASITVESGTHYYICTFGTHCSLGQKVTITAEASNDTTTSPPPPGTTTSPPPPSTASSLTHGTFFSLSILSITFAFLH